MTPDESAASADLENPTQTNEQAETREAAAAQPPVPLAPRPRRRARLLVDLEADDADELHRALKRIISRVSMGAPTWSERTEKTTGRASVEIREFCLKGRPHLLALEAWEKSEAEAAQVKGKGKGKRSAKA